MLFSSIPFLYLFLPIVLIIYFICPKKLKNSVLLLSGLVFYAWGEPKYVVIMIISILVGYVFGLLIEKFIDTKLAKLFLILSVSTDLGLLLYFKYADFFIYNFNEVTNLSIPLLKIALPIGISFYTFQILSYTVDVYRKTVPAQKNPINLGAYIVMFPQLIAGPIVRYSDIESQLNGRAHSIEKIYEGIIRFVIGLAKKIILANSLGEICQQFNNSSQKSFLFFWLYAIAFTLQIYFDFSGYSDMAIGLGKIFGFKFLENFNYPYISKSITEFWRRWHMSLGGWFRDYVYIPLGGNRVGKIKQYRNIFIVWILTGFWHGANWNFILWGLYFAVILCAEKLLYKKYLEKSKVFSRVYVMLLVIISFVIFNANSISEVAFNLKGMIGINTAGVVGSEFLYCFRSYFVLLLIAIIAATPLAKNIINKLKAIPKAQRVINALSPVFDMLILILCTAYLVDGSFNPFLYFRF